MIYDETLSEIERGKNGLNTGIPITFTRLSHHVPNIQQRTYYLIGGESGSGKSALVDEIFVYQAIEWMIANKDNTNIKLHIKYFSFEIDKVRKISKFIARRIYTKYKILVDINYVLSKGKNRISDEVYEAVIKERNFFYQMEEYLDIIDTPMSPTGVYKTMSEHANNNGVWTKQGYNNIYIPNDPNLYTLNIVDHVGLTPTEAGLTKKQTIDKLSNNAITLRNKCGFSSIHIQQLNRDLSSSDRFKIHRVEPQLSDFKESGNPVENADLVFAVFSPARYELPTFHKYNSARLGRYLRSLHLLKNRDGEADTMIGMGFIGEVGLFFEMPKSAEMTEDIYKRFENFQQKHS